MAVENFPDLDAIACALAEQIENISEIRTWHYVPDNLTPTCCVVEIENVEDATVQREWDIELSVWLICGNAWDRAAQENVRQLIPIVRNGIRPDTHVGGTPHLNGLVDDLILRRVTIQRQISVADVTFSGAVFSVDAIT